jgi:hypothetical protein
VSEDELDPRTMIDASTCVRSSFVRAQGASHWKMVVHTCVLLACCFDHLIYGEAHLGS